MKYIYMFLFLIVIFVGCGYKTSPIYVEDNKKIEMER